MISRKSIFITGASRGIGRALALRLADGRNRLGLLARNKAELESVAESCRQQGAEAMVFAGDITDEGFIQESAAAMESAFGPLDYLVNNAGYGIFKPADEIGLAEWRELMDVNVAGTFVCCKYFMPGMKGQGSGHIVNIASDVAKRNFANGSLYCASKYAQDAFSGALRKELRPFGIKVSVVYSGLVDTHFHGQPGAPHAATWLSDQDMADAIYYVMDQPPHVVVDELMIHPLSQEY
jgi:NADP-dependent 3-hydroxy acid dehydrogenase YdfG